MTIFTKFTRNEEWDMAMKLWWAQSWRAWPLAMLASIPAGALYYLIVRYAGVDPIVQQIMGAGLGFTIGLIFMIWVNKLLLVKGFGKYRLQLVEKDDAK